jgi:hypothetical protein
MSWKPSEIEIVDYLYGELSPEMIKKFDDYLKENTAFAKEVNDLRLTQEILPGLADEEVIPPLPIADSTKGRSRRGYDRKWLYPVSIAASVAALLVIGYFTRFSVSIGNEGFIMGFNNTPSNPVETMSKEEILKLINNEVSLASNDWHSGMTVMQKSFATQLQQNQKLTEAEIKKVAAMKPSSKIGEEQILAFIAQLQDENKKAMQTFYQVSAEDQQMYMRNVLLEFHDYLDEQRQKDLQYIQANMLELKSTSELKQEETDKILASIITTVNSQNPVGE